MYLKETCNYCNNLKKYFLDKDQLVYDACCGRCLHGVRREPKPIQMNVGPMIDVIKPTWCPKDRGIVVEYYPENLALPSKTTEVKEEPKKKYMTYNEKREALMALPRHLSLEEIEEGEIYVIPKLQTQKRKVIKVIQKSDTHFRYCEIDENGKESSYSSTVYPKDIEYVFVIKLHRF